MSKTIQNIGQKIKSKLRQLCLKPDISPVEFVEEVNGKKHRYFSPCQTISREKVGFYARLHDNPDAKRKFINEIKFLKKIGESDLEIKKVIPKIYSSRIEKNYEWFVREYPEATPLGHSRQLDKIISKTTIPALTKNIMAISRIPIKKMGLELKKFKPGNYSIKTQYHDLVYGRGVPMEIAREVTKLAEKDYQLLSDENHYPSHGDLNLGNILTEKNKIWIIDWELFQINNFAYDMGYFWAHLWQAPQTFRQALMLSFIKNLKSGQLEKFKKLLPIIAAYLSVGGISFRKAKNEKLQILERRKKFYLQLLKNCAATFSRLIKT